jgi:hypothetical protein
MEAVQLHQVRVRVTHGPDTGREAVATGGELSIGTAPGNQLVLSDPTVSRHHLALRCTEYGYWVRDLGSTNGVRIGARLVQVAAVTDGCEVVLGDTRLVFELLEEEAGDGWVTLDGHELPPLRERRDDIPGLVAHFYRQLTDGEPPPEALVRAFVRMDWPGNVRELRDAVERAVVLGAPGLEGEAAAGVEPAVLTDEFDPRLSFRDAKERAVARWERWYVAQLLRHTHGNLSEAARVARSDRTYLRKLARKHLHRDGDRDDGWERR